MSTEKDCGLGDAEKSPWTPSIARTDQVDPLRTMIFQALGAASICHATAGTRGIRPEPPSTTRGNAMSYAMNSDPSTWPPNEPSDAATDAYVNSEQFVTDAIDWASTGAHRHPALFEMILDYYAESPEAAAAIEDIVDGVRTVA